MWKKQIGGTGPEYHTQYKKTDLLDRVNFPSFKSMFEKLNGIASAGNSDGGVNI